MQKWVWLQTWHGGGAVGQTTVQTLHLLLVRHRGPGVDQALRKQGGVIVVDQETQGTPITERHCEILHLQVQASKLLLARMIYI